MLASVLSALLLLASAPSAFVRADQVGYGAQDVKRAVIVSSVALSGSYRVLTSPGRQPVLTGSIGPAGLSWSPAYPFTYAVDFSALSTPGTYVLAADGARTSAPFTVGTPRAVYRDLPAFAQFFYLAQRDGSDVNPTVMSREPSHLKDARAFTYLQPVYDQNDVLLSDLQALRLQPVIDASGGWFDAGDFLKFVQTASYVDAVMLLAVRDDPKPLESEDADFFDEARYGTSWLAKMWNDDTKTLYYQVGIGSGNQRYASDHSYWRLPQFDDTGFGVGRGDVRDPNYYVVYRPVFRANAPDGPISPNLAGRVAADFALCYQVYRNAPKMERFAASCLRNAQDVYALAATAPPPMPLLTASPHDFYPETEWRDDMELGAAELAIAAAEAHSPPPHDAGFYLAQARQWAEAYIRRQGQPPNRDTLNLYDDSALAHRELALALEQLGGPGAAKTIRDLIADLQAQLQTAVDEARLDPFGLGFGYRNGDVVPHALGVAVTAGLYDELTAQTTYRALEQSQIDYLFGENAWGTSFIVGAGAVFPHCMQHIVANLSGRLDGKPPIVYGATVDGPNSTIAYGTLPRMRDCPQGNGPDPFAPFDGQGAHYRDRVADWASVEPSDDYTVLNVLEFARQEDGRP